MPAYTSSLPYELLAQLKYFAEELGVPKNRIIERALSVYLKELDKAAYAKSFQSARGDRDLLSIAEEGMTDYLSQLDSWDETS